MSSTPTHRDTHTPIRVLFLLDKLAPAGTQLNLLKLAKNLDRTRFKPYVIAFQPGGSLEGEFRAAGVETYVHPTGLAYGPSGWKAWSFLVQWMEKFKPEIVQTHFLHADLLGSLAAKKAGVKKIITARRDEGFWRNGRQRMINRFLNRFADRILANSEAVATAVRFNEKVYRSRIDVIYNGVELGEINPELRRKTRESLEVAEDEILIGMVANMRHAIKGHVYLLEAFAEVLKKNPKVKLFLAGDGVLREKFEKYAETLGIKKNIIFLGSRRDIPALLNAMDIGILTSVTEGFSNAVLEYMAYGKPVVATAVGGNPEALNSETGFLVPARDPHALAEKLLTLAEDKNLRSRMGAAARKRVEEFFSVRKMVENYETYYENLVSEFRSDGVRKTPIPPYSHTPIRICFMIWSLDLGGAEQVVLNLVQKLDRQKFEPIVCCLNEKGRYAPELEKEGIKVIAMHKKPKLDPTLLFRLVKLLKEEKIDLIHTHLFTSNLWGRLAAKFATVPVINTEHNMDTWKKKYHFAADRFLSKISEYVIFVSENAKKFYQERAGNLKEKSIVVYNGIDTEKFTLNSYDRDALKKSLGIPLQNQVLGIVGRIVPQKAHEDFLEAIRLLKEKEHSVTGLIIGDGELRAELEQKAREKGIEKDVLFLGFRSDLNQLYHAMDVLVLCSYREGFPMTILESMASGVPVVATDVGGVSECLTHGEDGLLVPPAQPELLAEAITELLTDEKFKKKVLINAYKKVTERFSIQTMVDRHEFLYKEVLEK